MITYRAFRNWDTPQLVELWNSSVSGRGVAHPIEVSDLDRLVLSKPYFDSQGITVAEQDGCLVGFVHAGFGASDDNRGLCRDFGVIAMLLVSPSHRRRGMARELVRRAEAYLHSCGSSVLYAGSIYPLDPFYRGLYGGSEMPGILCSDQAAHQLFRALGYRPVDECLVFQRALEQPLRLADPEAESWAAQADFQVNLHPPALNWWSACQYAGLEHADFAVRLKDTGMIVARARGWEMYPLEKAWGAKAVGIVDVQVQPDYRRRRLGVYLMGQILRYYRDHDMTVAEVQTMARSAPARGLYQRLGFAEIDRGMIYRAVHFEVGSGGCRGSGRGWGCA